MKLLKKTNSLSGILTEYETHLIKLNEQLIAHDEEIKYLEEYLTTTSGPAEEVMEDLKRNQKRRNEINFEYSAIMKKMKEIQDAN